MESEIILMNFSFSIALKYRSISHLERAIHLRATFTAFIGQSENVDSLSYMDQLSSETFMLININTNLLKNVSKYWIDTMYVGFCTF